jgi:hypothetical protein
MLHKALRDILATTLDYGIEGNIVRVSQAIFPQEVIIHMPTMPDDYRISEANLWCLDHIGTPAYVRQYGVSLTEVTKHSAWAVFHYRYYFMNADHAFHFKMIYG